jgi:tetratricopeptide (TPR) repeat protein
MSLTPDRSGLPVDVLRARFTNRAAIVRLFEDLIEDGNRPVVSIYGIGGVGKSTVIRFLRLLLEERAGSRTPPSALLTFQPGRTPHSAPEALWDLRAQLAKADGYHFTRFDILWATWWERTYHTPISRNPSLLSDEAQDLADLLDMLSDVPVLGTAVKIAKLTTRSAQSGRRRFEQHQVQNWLSSRVRPPGNSRDWRTGLRQLELSRLAELLPAALAGDLADRDRSLPAMALFVDTYERLEDAAEEVDGTIRPTFVRELVEALCGQHANVIVVIAGRNRLRWAERRDVEGRWNLDPTSPWGRPLGAVGERFQLRQVNLDTFNDADSLTYLEGKRGVAPDLAREIASATSGLPLALAATCDLLDESSGEDVSVQGLRALTAGLEPLSSEWLEQFSRWLLDRLITQLVANQRQELVGLLRGAAVSRWFNEDLLFEMVDGGPSFQDEFDQLTRYGFIEPRLTDVTNLAVFSVHPVVRRHILRTFRLKRQLNAWNDRALAYFRDRYESAEDPEEKYLYHVELLYHSAIAGGESELVDVRAAFDEYLGSFEVTRAFGVARMVRDLMDRGMDCEAASLALRGRVKMGSADYPGAIDDLDRALAQSRRSSDPAFWEGYCETYLAEASRLSARYPQALRLFRDLLMRAEGQQDKRLRLTAVWGLSLTYKLLEQFDDSLRTCLQAERLASEVPDAEYVDAHTFGVSQLRTRPGNMGRHKSELLRQMGDYGGAAAAAETFAALYADNPESLGYAYSGIALGHLLRMEGRLGEAEENATKALVAFEHGQNLRGELSAVRLLAQVLCDAALSAQSSEQAERLIAAAGNSYPYGEVYARLVIGENLRLAGDWSAALQSFRQALNVCVAREFGIEVAYAHLGMAQASLDGGRPGEAVDHSRAALRLARQLANPWTELHALLSEAAADPRTGVALVESAVEVERRFRRRGGDRRLELSKVDAARIAIGVGDPPPPLRLNFL